MTRQRLPNRREQVTEEIRWLEPGGQLYKVSIGLDDERIVREIWIRSTKIGSDMEALLDDACVLVSRLLQNGAPLEVIVRTLGREGADPSSPSASILGYALKRALEMTKPAPTSVGEVKQEVAPHKADFKGWDGDTKEGTGPERKLAVEGQNKTLEQL